MVSRNYSQLCSADMKEQVGQDMDTDIVVAVDMVQNDDGCSHSNPCTGGRSRKESVVLAG